MFRSAAVLVLLSSCLIVGPPPPGPPPLAPGTCVDDTDCPSTQYQYCDTRTSLCAAQCANDSECNARPAEFAIAECEQGLGCRCDESRCVPRLCSADSECGSGQACRDGACVMPPAASSIAGCVITPDFKILRPGERARFDVLAWDARQAPVVIPTGATWTLPDGATAYGDEVQVLAPATSSFTVHASFGAVTCDARGQVSPLPATGELVALVIDERTGRPIPNVKVVLSARDGTALQQVESDAAGLARLQQTGDVFSLTAFHADFSYLTVANADAATAQLTLALRRNPYDRYGGFTGTFGNMPLTSNVHFARVGWSVDNELSELDLSDPPRPWVPTRIRIGSAIDRVEPMPASSFMGFGESVIKGDVWALGANGTCVDASGQPDEAAITAGACGTGAAWGLAADLPLGDFPIDLFDSDQFFVLNRLASFAPFASWVRRDVPFGLRPTPGADAGTYDITDRSHFKTVTAEFGQTPLAFVFLSKLPPLPRYRAQYVDRVFSVGGAWVPGRGLVPLGLGTGTNARPGDALVDERGPTRAGQLRVRMAPAHHGLEGTPYTLVTQASSSVRPDDPMAGRSLSAIVSRFPGNALPFDADEVKVDLSAGAFPQVPEGARFDGATRSFRLATPPADVSVLRVSFTDGLPTSWEVLVDPASPSFTLPAVPGTLRDRLFFNGERSRLVVRAQRLEGIDTFAKYLGLGGPAAPLTGFSYEQVRPLRITLDLPPVLARRSWLEIGVEGFVVGTGPEADGVVALSFTGGVGCSPVVLNTAVNGTVSHQLTQSCTGPAVRVRAELMKPDGVTPLTPPVAWTVSTAIQ